MKVSLEDFKRELAGMDENRLACVEGKLMAEVSLGAYMLELVRMRQDYLESINFNNVTKRANGCIRIVSPEGECL